MRSRRCVVTVAVVVAVVLVAVAVQDGPAPDPDPAAFDAGAQPAVPVVVDPPR